jgi:hypothetical protein
MRACKLSLLLAGALLAATGCDMSVDIEMPIPAHEPRLVVNSLFETGAPLEVELSRSLGVGDSRSHKIRMGTVRLYENGQLVEELDQTPESIREMELSAIFRSRHIIRPASTYRLEASAFGLRDVHAEEQTLALPTVRVVGIEHGESRHGHRIDRITFEIVDPGERVYYRLTFPTSSGTVEDGRPNFFPSPFRSDDPVLRNSWFSDIFEFDNDRFHSEVLFTNATFDGRPFTTTVEVMRPSYGPHQAPSETFLRLDRVSETYYRYIRARREVNQAEGNPFAEPVFMPTNVRGGFGIFAGRSGERIPLDFGLAQ